jgi:hypothetical protein
MGCKNWDSSGIKGILLLLSDCARKEQKLVVRCEGKSFD